MSQFVVLPSRSKRVQLHHLLGWVKRPIPLQLNLAPWVCLYLLARASQILALLKRRHHPENNLLEHYRNILFPIPLLEINHTQQANK